MPDQKHTTHDIPVDALLNVLADPYRRRVLSYLRTRDTNAVTLDELVEHVQKHVDVVTSFHHARIVLVHQHLPMLADHRLNEYDRQSQTVRYWESTMSDAVFELNTLVG
ncbi:DUF7344 domain-containing protein [Haladaptatus halobius]|uniref:DUF7344 domain-containing protein n=1 Tax=Haladaptatus halobius TaxID=2884875 RepID=UPI001D0AD6AE|nr:hypothetical protein [Haladaptatus halobius]